MDIGQLKQYIYDNNFVEEILNDIGCHAVRYHGSYWTCANKDGDNASAITVYNSEWLGVINYTRQMISDDRKTDLIDLVCFTKQISFLDGLKYLSQLLGVDYYHDFDDDLPESLSITALMHDMSEGCDNEIEKPLKPISERILSYYMDCVNDLFAKDGISYETQQEFEIGYDPETNRITIPIRDELNNLVGVKGRLFKEDLDESDTKYLYIERCAKSKILYGLYKNYEAIIEAGEVYVGEAEKFVMQLSSNGYHNAVATGGKTLSKHQIDMLIRLGVRIIFCFDSDVKMEDIDKIAKWIPEGIDFYYMMDVEGDILKEKESPSDDMVCWVTKLLQEI